MKARELLKTKETYNKEYPTISLSDAEEAMIEFAQTHVKEALKRADNNAKMYNSTESIKDSILNAYPLTNIK